MLDALHAAPVWPAAGRIRHARVLVFAKDEITEDEKKEVKRIMILVQAAIYRR
jgi:hypothetical protein